MIKLQFSHFKEFSSINHFITTRKGGVSSDKFSSLNLSYKVGDNNEFVSANRKIVADLLNIGTQKLYFPDQCHTSNIKIIIGKVPELSETDALITNEQNIGIGVLAADCIPLLFYDSKKNVIAAAHAGWRGTVKQIGPKVIEEMINHFNSDAENIKVGIGPGISQMNYEVDNVVINEIKKILPVSEHFIKASVNTGRYYLNLQELNRELLINSGILPSNIEVMEKCTFENSSLFFSARRDGFSTGRFGAVIALN